MKKNSILLIFACTLVVAYVSLLFVSINGVIIKEVWFSLACVFIGLYSLLYYAMFKLDSSLYYGTLVLGVGVASFFRHSFMYSFGYFYPVYFFCFALASFAVFAVFRQKIHFKLFAILFVECILLIVYKLNYLNFASLAIINGIYLIILGINAILRIRKNLKES